MPYYVYILQSTKDRNYCTGVSVDVKARLEFHNCGLQSSTRHRRPFILILVEQYPEKKTALRREREIKSWKGGNKFKSLIERSSPAQRGTTFGT